MRSMLYYKNGINKFSELIEKAVERKLSTKVEL